MTIHICKEATHCMCSQLDLEPWEGCPVHGHPWPPRCEVCGRIMSFKTRGHEWPEREEKHDL